MTDLRLYFQKNPKIRYIVNALLTIFLLTLFPLFIFHGFSGFIVGLVLDILILNFIGAAWSPWKAQN